MRRILCQLAHNWKRWERLSLSFVLLWKGALQHSSEDHKASQEITLLMREARRLVPMLFSTSSDSFRVFESPTSVMKAREYQTHNAIHFLRYNECTRHYSIWQDSII